MNKEIIKKEDILYYARIMPKLGIYDVCEIKVRTVQDTYFCGTDKRDERTYIFKYEDMDKVIFTNRINALNTVKLAEDKNYEEENYNGDN